MSTLSFRPITEADLDFLNSVYASTRAEEMALVDWGDEQKTSFLKAQFSAQHQYYQQHYTDTEFLIILSNDEQIGRFYIARWPAEIRIVDLALLPEFRNLGYGSKILKDVLAEASEIVKSVTIHVERFNPARNLYQRLGFVKKSEHGIYDLMERSVASS